MATIKKAQNVFKVMFKKNEAEIKEETYFTIKPNQIQKYAENKINIIFLIFQLLVGLCKMEVIETCCKL